MKKYYAPYGDKFHVFIFKHEGNVYRAYTNQAKTYFEFIENMAYHKNSDDAQRDLDDLAKKNRWKEIPNAN